MNSPRRLSAFATVLVGVTVLGACTSTPSNRRVVEDIVESLELPQSVEDCMLAVVDRYDGDALDRIADANEDFALTPDGELANPTDALADFQAALQRCVEGETSGTEVPGSEVPGSEPAESSEPAGSTSPAESSEPAGSTSPATTLG